MYYNSRGRKLIKPIEIIKNERKSIFKTSRIDQLMGLEGRIRNIYYRCWNIILKEAPSFTKRKKRPPNNEVNALISFGNSLIYTATLSEIYHTQLDPSISFLHEPGTKRFSLSLDISEIYKPILIDRMIFKLWNNNEIRSSSFKKNGDICLINDQGRLVMLKEFDERMKTTIKHRKTGKHLTYKQLIRRECYKLIKHVIGDEQYTPFKAWW
jgi:CRISPR-associated protein Cas1